MSSRLINVRLDEGRLRKALELVASEEFAAMEETLHLLSTSANAERLRQGLADDAAGKLHPGDLCD